MKKLFISLLVLVSLSAQAQTRKQSSVLTDSIVMVQGAIEIEPIIVNAQGDSARSINFNAFNVTPDTASGCQTYVQLFDKNGRSIADFNCPIPASVKNVWGTDDSVIFNYILLMNPRFKKVVPQKN
jgi:hypothetical protein